MRWGIEKRLEFIEFRVFWEGGINRADIIDQFGVSVPQASIDLSQYENRAPGNLQYDKSAKRYQASGKFKPIFLNASASAYLSHLKSTAGPCEVFSGSWLATAPSVGEMPIPQRRISVDVLRATLAAIRGTQSLEIYYQSMNVNRPNPQWRRITPHALGNDGLRWHVRAFCHIDKKFKDFVLSRCTSTREFCEPGALPKDDYFWNEWFIVHLTPNPVLSKSQQNVIAQDYEMHDGHAEVHVRKALLYYFHKRMRLDVTGDLYNPHEVPVVIANNATFDKALSEAMA